MFAFLMGYQIVAWYKAFMTNITYMWLFLLMNNINMFFQSWLWYKWLSHSGQLTLIWSFKPCSSLNAFSQSPHLFNFFPGKFMDYPCVQVDFAAAIFTTILKTSFKISENLEFYVCLFYGLPNDSFEQSFHGKYHTYTVLRKYTQFCLFMM